MYYTIYKITNVVDNKIYIGKHKTNDLNDGYMGSGLVLKRAIKKYGLDKFSKEILYVFDNEIEMGVMESKIVDGLFILREDTYNIKLGGDGGFDYINAKGLNLHEGNKKGGVERANQVRKDEEFLQKQRTRWINMVKERHEKGLVKYDTFTGKTHSEETKKKIGEANSIKQLGEKNSVFGKVWIHNIELKQNKMIDPKELDLWLKEKWIQGRRMNFSLNNMAF